MANIRGRIEQKSSENRNGFNWLSVRGSRGALYLVTVPAGIADFFEVGKTYQFDGSKTERVMTSVHMVREDKKDWHWVDGQTLINQSEIDRRRGDFEAWAAAIG